MRRISYQLAVVLIACSASYAVAQCVPAATNDIASSTGSVAVTAPQQLTEEQIASFKKMLKDEKTSTMIVLDAAFAPANLDPKAKTKYAKSGKIPYLVTCSLLEVKNPDSKRPLSKKLGGNSQFYLLDPEGKILEKRSVSLDKMCPS